MVSLAGGIYLLDSTQELKALKIDNSAFEKKKAGWVVGSQGYYNYDFYLP